MIAAQVLMLLLPVYCVTGIPANFFLRTRRQDLFHCSKFIQIHDSLIPSQKWNKEETNVHITKA